MCFFKRTTFWSYLSDSYNFGSNSEVQTSSLFTRSFRVSVNTSSANKLTCSCKTDAFTSRNTCSQTVAEIETLRTYAYFTLAYKVGTIPLGPRGHWRTDPLKRLKLKRRRIKGIMNLLKSKRFRNQWPNVTCCPVAKRRLSGVFYGAFTPVVNGWWRMRDRRFRPNR